MTTLKNCPFCGSQPFKTFADDLVMCTKKGCSIEQILFNVQTWNTRVEPAPKESDKSSLVQWHEGYDKAKSEDIQAIQYLIDWINKEIRHTDKPYTVIRPDVMIKIESLLRNAPNEPEQPKPAHTEEQIKAVYQFVKDSYKPDPVQIVNGSPCYGGTSQSRKIKPDPAPISNEAFRTELERRMLIIESKITAQSVLFIIQSIKSELTKPTPWAY